MPSVELKSKDEARVRVFNPSETRMSTMVVDNPYFWAINNKWRDRQGVSRITFESMLRHGDVAGPFRALINFLKSSTPKFVSSQQSPTKRQQTVADFANDMLSRLGATGNAVDGYDALIEWFGLGLAYGFSLSEMTTTEATWQGQKRIVVDRIIPLPQATLDAGYIPREEYGQLMSRNDPRYRCFKVSPSGLIEAIYQFHSQGDKETRIEWTGADLLRILHYAHASADGNPHGEPLLWAAYYHWAALYTIEQLEEVFLDAGFPWLGISYKTADGRPSPAYHAQVIELLQKQDPAIRALILPDTTFSSVAATNKDFVEHATRKKEELRRSIRQIIGVPLSTYGEPENAGSSDARNLIGVFFKHILPAIQKEVSNVLTWQFSKRLIDANWGTLPVEDYPVLQFQNITQDDLRVSQEMLKMSFGYIDSDRLGEAIAKMVPGFDANWIPKDHANSVSKKRELPDNTGGKQADKTGTQDQRKDGQTTTPSSVDAR